MDPKDSNKDESTHQEVQSPYIMTTIPRSYFIAFGERWGSDVIKLKPEHLEALKNGQCVAIDILSEYVAYLILDSKEGEDNGS